MRIAFDYDGTITKNPFLFKILIDSLRLNNKIFIISGTVEENKAEMLEELNLFQISMSNITLLLIDKKSNLKEVTKWKFDMIDKHKIRCYFENRKETAKKITELCTVFNIL